MAIMRLSVLFLLGVVVAVGSSWATAAAPKTAEEISKDTQYNDICVTLLKQVVKDPKDF
ncbi:OLC1v1030068C1 [Oldenlandia corymbosa var. corymbosa]|uniref:OLC1v1030068C1 n=1 Tax=Oldenlandia corymbosa var. corymbosa TaxID=529605 RepID=A0AAV1CH26_OLDCO|nr:OLC1v1030068C1 [Oldenlandia corymbosa var. corymbosa]